MTLGQVVRAWREERGWKQEDLARRAGLTQSTIAYVESDRFAHPSTKTLGGLARAFGLSIDSLLAAGAGADVALPPATEPPVELPEGLDPKWAADFLKYGQRLTAHQRQSLLQLARSLAQEAAEQDAPVGKQQTRPQRKGKQQLASGGQADE